MSDDKRQLTISIDMKVSDRQYQVVENSVTSILFQLTDTAARYVYNIHMREMKKQSETTAAGLSSLDFKKECNIPVDIRADADQVFRLSEKYQGNIMLVEFFKYEGIPVLCAQCALIVKPANLKIAQVFFKDWANKEVGCGSVQYEADLRFALRVKYNRPLLRGENAPKLKCKAYCTNAVTGRYEEISKFRVDENGAYTDTFYCNDGLQESHAGAGYVFSFGINNPYGPPFMIEDANAPAPSIQKIHLIGRNLKKPLITSVVWSSKEMIKFGEDPPRRKDIYRNEGGFLHIHTRGMYGQKVRVELFEKDSTGIKKLLLGIKDDVAILDNVVCVPVEMSGVYAKAGKGRYALAEGLSFEIMAKVIPLDTSIAAFEQDDESLIELKIYGKADEDKAAKSTVNGTMKFVIADVEEDEKEEKATEESVCPLCGKKHIDLRSKMTFKKQSGATDCKVTCDKIISPFKIKSEGASVKLPNGKYGVLYQIANENPSKTALEFNPDNAKAGLIYIDSCLDKGYPVVVGVNHTFGKTYNDGTTDHFVVIVGKHCEDKTVYYRFWDVGSLFGESKDYKFELTEKGYLVCEKNYNNKRYDVTQIRKNIIIKTE